MKTTVIIRFEIEGLHYYPLAPDQVSFLANRHRHCFRIACGFAVSDLNREKEIFIERERLKKYLESKYGSPCEFGQMSCEMIAMELLTNNQHEGMVWAEVEEEHTGGARVELE